MQLLLPLTPKGNSHLTNIQFTMHSSRTTKTFVPLLSLIFILHNTRGILACQTVKDLLKLQHNRFFLYIRRGMPGNVTRMFYKSYNIDLVDYVKSIAPSGKPMGEVCMDSERKQEFKNRYKPSDIHQAIKDMRKLDPFMFYLPKSRYKDSELTLRSPTKKAKMDRIWSSISTELKKTAHDIDTDKLSNLPGGLFFFYDPNKSARCLAKLKLVPENPTRHKNAVSVTNEVVGMVVRLHLLGVPNMYSMHILRHHTANVFSLIRCLRKNNAKLPLTRSYFRWYREQFKLFTRDLDLSTVPEIPPEVIEKRLASRIKILSHYQGWGKLKFFSFLGKKVYREHIRKRIFDPTILELIRQDIGFTSVHQGNTGISNSTEKKRFPVVARSGECESGYFPHHNPPTTVCCPELCRNADTLGVVDFTEATCCGVCNYSSCDDDNELLTRLTSIYLDEYGYSPETYVSIMI